MKSIIIWLLVVANLALAKSGYSHLDGKHIIVSGRNGATAFRIVRNSTGHIIKASGISVHMLEWFSSFYNFTYSFIQFGETQNLEATEKFPGLISYVIRKECDILMGAVSPTANRIILLDFTHPYIHFPVTFIIPTPSFALNPAAILNPLDLWVWMYLIISIFVVILVLYYTSRWIRSRNKSKIENKKIDFNQILDYVFGVLLRQAKASCFSGRHSMMSKIIASAWCLAVLIITTYYAADLTSYITVPSYKPLLKSIYELPGRPDIHLVTNKGDNEDVIISSAKTGFLKELGNKLNSDLDSRCSVMKDCVDKVRAGSSVYTAAITYLLSAIRQNYLASGKCEFQLSQESYLNLPMSWALPKYSLYTEDINQGILRMHESGLIDHWLTWYKADANRCIGQSKEKRIAFIPLSIYDLTGLGLILLFGLIVAFFAFIGEHYLLLKKRLPIGVKPN